MDTEFRVWDSGRWKLWATMHLSRAGVCGTEGVSSHPPSLSSRVFLAKMVRQVLQAPLDPR